MTTNVTHEDVAFRLLVEQGAHLGSAGERAEAAGRVCRGLLGYFADLIGDDGARALFVRSVKLARASSPCLAHIYELRAERAAAGALPEHEFVRCLEELDAADVTAEATRVFTQFLALLANFIGERLVGRLIQSMLGEQGGRNPKETAE